MDTYSDGEVSCYRTLTDVHKLGDAHEEHRRWACRYQDEQEPGTKHVSSQCFLRATSRDDVD